VSVDAWKAVLASAMNAGNYASEDAIPYPRVINPPNGEYLGGNWDDEEATSGFLSIDGSDATDSELERLAQEIVREVKERAPFFGLSDFINRRLVASEHGDAGPIEAAIQRSGINAEFDENELLRIPNAERDRLRNVSFDNMRDATRLEQTQKPNSVAWGLPGYLTQGDVVQAIGSALRPRSDSFIVRAYGESVDVQGEVKARAWCEAIVQRSPEPINPDSSGLNPMAKRNPDDLEFGRRFKLVSFRWLNAEEVLKLSRSIPLSEPMDHSGPWAFSCSAEELPVNRKDQPQGCRSSWARELKETLKNRFDAPPGHERRCRDVFLALPVCDSALQHSDTCGSPGSCR
ncbi:MAG: hypothetical protein MK312_01625, partial [Roseibacillus sp.]|nr:hypothetical protein [Roseibacillus sp.]